MRERVTDVLEVVGVLAIIAGFGLWLGLAAALIVGGVLALAVSFLVSD